MKKNTDYKKTDGAYADTILPGIKYLKLGAPLSMQFELTSGCNQRCVFCYNVWKEKSNCPEPKTLTKKEQLKILDIVIENKILDIIFSGGEPLLVPWLEELVERISTQNIKSSLITNAILLTEEKAISLKKSGLSSIQISLHHHIEEINNYLVGSDTFQKTVTGIKNSLKIFGSDCINVNMVALPETYKDVYEMSKFLQSIGINHFSVGTPSATGEMSKNKEIIITKNNFTQIYNQLIKAKHNLKMNTSFTGGFPLCILPKIDKETLSMVNNYCDAGLNQLIISSDGSLRPCVCLNHNLGNILTDDLKKIWVKNIFLKNIRQLKYLPNECLSCQYIHMCRGGCRASAYGFYGKINANDPLIK